MTQTWKNQKGFRKSSTLNLTGLLKTGYKNNKWITGMKTAWIFEPKQCFHLMKYLTITDRLKLSSAIRNDA